MATPQTTIRPVSYSTKLQIRVPPVVLNLEDDGDSELLSDQGIYQEETDSNFFGNTTKPHKLSQAELNDLVHDLNLSKRQAEVLALRHNDLNLFETGTKICTFCERQLEFEYLFFV